MIDRHELIKSTRNFRKTWSDLGLAKHKSKLPCFTLEFFYLFKGGTLNFVDATRKCENRRTSENALFFAICKRFLTWRHEFLDFSIWLLCHPTIDRIYRLWSLFGKRMFKRRGFEHLSGDLGVAAGDSGVNVHSDQTHIVHTVIVGWKNWLEKQKKTFYKQWESEV